MREGEVFNPWRFFRGVFIPQSILKQFKIPQGAKVLYGLLCRFSGKDGNCFPRQERLAEELGVTIRTVQRWLCRLQTEQLIRRVIFTRAGRVQNSYVFLWVNLLKSGQACLGETSEMSSHGATEMSCHISIQKNPSKGVTRTNSSRRAGASVENTPAQRQLFPEIEELSHALEPAAAIPLPANVTRGGPKMHDSRLHGAPSEAADSPDAREDLGPVRNRSQSVSELLTVDEIKSKLHQTAALLTDWRRKPPPIPGLPVVKSTG